MMFSDNKVAPLSAATRFHVAVLASQVISFIVFKLESTTGRLDGERCMIAGPTVGVDLSIRLNNDILSGTLVFKVVFPAYVERAVVSCWTVVAGTVMAGPVVIWAVTRHVVTWAVTWHVVTWAVTWMPWTWSAAAAAANACTLVLFSMTVEDVKGFVLFPVLVVALEFTRWSALQHFAGML